MTEQFIKVDNEKIKRKPPIKYLRELGLYMIIQAFLSNPEFKKANGGLKAAAASHCSNGTYSFNAAWNNLKKYGLLKRYRLPIAHNKFHDCYTLLPMPDKAAPVKHLNFKDGQAFLKDIPTAFNEVFANYTAISYKMIMDKNISLAAKGLYAVIQRLILIEYNTNEEMLLNKQIIKSSCKEGNCTFNTLWKELKNSGYLIMQQSYSHKHKRTKYIYSLSHAPSITNKKDNPKGKEKRKDTFIETQPAVGSVSREIILAKLKKQIDYDLLEENTYSQSHDVCYSKQDLDHIVNLIIDTLMYSGEYVKINKANIPLSAVLEQFKKLDTDMIHQVLNQCFHAPSKYNPKAYKITLLYNLCAYGEY